MPVLRAVPLALLAACQLLDTGVRYAPVGDYHTGSSRVLAEGGHAEPVAPPRGIKWIARVDGVREEILESLPVRHFAFELTFLDSAAQPGQVTAAPIPETAVLVDDEGREFECAQASLPKTFDIKQETKAVAAGDPLQRDFTLIFELPTNYRFESVDRLTVHWSLRFADGRELQISSRFEA